MVQPNRKLHRSSRLSNESRIDHKVDSKIWYQSSDSIPRNREQLTRWKDKRAVRSNERFKKNLWSLRKREVLMNLQNLTLNDQLHINHLETRSHKISRRIKRSKCYLCHIRGHFYWNCPNMNRKDEIRRGKSITAESWKEEQPKISITKQDVLGTDEKGWDEIWYISEDHSSHMTPNLKLFYKFTKEPMGTSSMNQEGFDVQGTGDVLVETDKHRFVIPGALYVPTIDLNILSQSKLEHQGFKITFDGHKCHIEGMFGTSTMENMDMMQECEGSNKMKMDEDMLDQDR